MASIKTVLDNLRVAYSNESKRDKGTSFEKLIANFLKIDKAYSYKDVWMWGDFVGSHPEYEFSRKDIGIDLVAELKDKTFCAIQCKFYSEEHNLVKEDIDSFFTLSGNKCFTERLIVITTNNVSDNVSKSFKNQHIPVNLITLATLENSSIDWGQFDIEHPEDMKPKAKKEMRDYQKDALGKAVEYFKYNDRGKLIMACGTGKTYVSLKIMEAITPQNANILFLVPSLSLLSQTLKEWSYEAGQDINSYAVCSDVKVGKDEDLKLHELDFPATTRATKLLENFNYQETDGRRVIFSTYQSLDVIKEAQSKGLPEFDMVICDEAHRTTGIINGATQDASNFVMIHDNNNIQAKKRMYMTATPRIYAPNAKKTAEKKEIEISSMDDDKIYGKNIYELKFSDAVKDDLLSDYKVMVYVVPQSVINADMQSILTEKDNTLDLNDLAKLVGCYNGLSKKTDDANIIDTNPMKRAVMFAGRIDVSIQVKNEFEKISGDLGGLKCKVQHIDGKTNILERNKWLNWLKHSDEPIPDGECRIISNARCLSEGVDVPALDAVIFLNPKDSEIDIIQAVGRVMRKSGDKKFGYVILPVVVPIGEDPNNVLNGSNYKIIWNTLESLRAHDEKMDREINQLEYNGESSRIHIIGVGINTEQFFFDFHKDEAKIWKDAIRVKIIEKCGDRDYTSNWAKDIGDIVKVHIAMITEILKQNDDDRAQFDNFVNELRNNINPTISQDDAIVMLSQHLVTKPVFETLFNDDFTKINPVSRAMDKVINLLDEKGLKNETVKLEGFYESVKNRVAAIKNPEGKQKLIIDLYDKFFAHAVPKESDKYGIVYTPVEIVDFIIHSVEYILNKEFDTKIENEHVHILDPFTGTGTFITRLLYSNLISKDRLEMKYKQELHANEIMLLSYYIAAINIEETYKFITENYEPFAGIVMTDTFRMLEDEYKEAQEQYYGSLDTDDERLYPLKRNSKRALKQKQQDIRVIIGNPPYSATQKNENDNNKADEYPKLDEKIANTYVKNSTAKLKQNLYDSYIRAFRWATDRIKDKGVICFITNGSYINGKALDGFRKSLTDEFTSVYCFNLKGNFRAYNKDEGENVFGNKCGTTVAITLLVKNPEKVKNNKVFYYEIDGGLKTEEKLNFISKLESIQNVRWQDIVPNESQDWIKQKNPVFLDFIPLGDKTGRENKRVFKIYSGGVKTQRDSWCYNFSKEKLKNNIRRMIDFYNSEVDRYNNEPVDNFVNNDPKKISWSEGLKNRLKNKKKLEYNEQDIIQAIYRPFCKQWLYYNGTVELNERVYQMPQIFPNDETENLLICVNGAGDKQFTCIITNKITDLNSLHSGMQAFPLYYYRIDEHSELFKSETPLKYKRNDNISDEFLKEINDKYMTIDITKEYIFYYIYGILHNEDCRKTFANDLTKMLPRIPFIEEFEAVSKLGKELANLHINYETISENFKDSPEDQIYRIEKMKFGKGKDKTIIIYNNYITLKGIPLEAYDYIVNGRPAIEWIMNQYKVSVNDDSGIKNDPNDLLKETGNYRYIIDLIKKTVNLSIKSVGIIKEISKYKIDESGY